MVVSGWFYSVCVSLFQCVSFLNTLWGFTFLLKTMRARFGFLRDEVGVQSVLFVSVKLKVHVSGTKVQMWRFVKCLRMTDVWWQHNTPCDRAGTSTYISTCIKHPIAHTSTHATRASRTQVVKKYIWIPAAEVEGMWLDSGLWRLPARARCSQPEKKCKVCCCCSPDTAIDTPPGWALIFWIIVLFHPPITSATKACGSYLEMFRKVCENPLIKGWRLLLTCSFPAAAATRLRKTRASCRIHLALLLALCVLSIFSQTSPTMTSSGCTGSLQLCQAPLTFGQARTGVELPCCFLYLSLSLSHTLFF